MVEGDERVGGVDGLSEELVHDPIEGGGPEALGQGEGVTPELLLARLVQRLQRVTVHQELQEGGRKGVLKMVS